MIHSTLSPEAICTVDLGSHCCFTPQSTLVTFVHTPPQMPFLPHYMIALFPQDEFQASITPAQPPPPLRRPTRSGVWLLRTQILNIAMVCIGRMSTIFEPPSPTVYMEFRLPPRAIEVDVGAQAEPPIPKMILNAMDTPSTISYHG